MLKQRILTACILIPLALAVLFYLSPLSFGFLTAFVVLGGAWEWSKLIGLTKNSHRVFYILLIGMSCLASLVITKAWIFGIATIWWCFAFLLIIFYPRGHAYWAKNKIISGSMGVIVLVPAWVALNFIRLQTDGLYALLFLFILIWGADSAAYFVGKKWGKHKCIPAVSPGKSWEGLGGAFIITLLMVCVLLWAGKVSFSLWAWALLLSFLTVLFSIEGDLFESMLKREAGVKDSGQLLPGHGGILDRIDSLTAGAPIFAYGAWLLGTYINP